MQDKYNLMVRKLQNFPGVLSVSGLYEPGNGNTRNHQVQLNQHLSPKDLTKLVEGVGLNVVSTRQYPQEPHPPDVIHFFVGKGFLDTHQIAFIKPGFLYDENSGLVFATG